MYNSPDGWWPEVGDQLIVVASSYEIESHARLGDVRTVVSVEPEINIVGLDSCSCKREGGCRWSWNGSHRNKFEPYVAPMPITPEEAAKAQPLPDPDDVINFLKRT